MSTFIELNNDQRREIVNTRQRYQAWRAAREREQGYRGSLVWEATGGRRYLLRSSYDESGKRRQRSLGPESPETTAIKEQFDAGRLEASSARKSMDAVLERQTAINRAIGVGRVPITAARILRLIDSRGLLGKGLRVVGTNALFAYEAACGVFLDASLTSTEDIDLLYDARRRLHLVGDPDLPGGGLVELLRRADRSFVRTRQPFRARNDEGFLVDLIRPMPRPAWRSDPSRLGGEDDLEPAEIEGLAWLESAPTFEQIVIDEKGGPLRMVAADPRVFAIHKHWISTRPDRNPVKKIRDRDQARMTAALVRDFLPHLPFDPSELRMVPRDVVAAALDDFATS